MNITYHSIGIIHSPFKDLQDMPIQPSSEAIAPGIIEVYPEYVDGLHDLGGFSHIILLYHLHKVSGYSLTVMPFLDNEPHGLFATRAPVRPNPIGLSVVKLTHIEGNLLHVDGLDILDETPLLDLKPYVPEFDYRPDVRIGWLEQAKDKIRSRRSDNRFK